MGHSTSKTKYIQITNTVKKNIVTEINNSNKFRVNDNILSINGKSINGMTITNIEKLFTPNLKILIRRKNKIKEIIIKDFTKYTINYEYEYNDICGVGLIIQRDISKNVIIADIIKNSPCKENGNIQIGDKLISVNNIEVNNESISNIAKRIIGTEGTNVLLEIEHVNNRKIVNLVRRKLVTKLDAIIINNIPIGYPVTQFYTSENMSNPLLAN